MRLDIALVKNNLAPTRSKAIEIIKSGNVLVNEKIVTKPGIKIKNKDKIKIIDSEYSPLKFVSRAGLKLYHALKIFNIDIKNKICLDVGASTGGFTDCLLKNGAKYVVCVDVGTNQIHPSIAKNPKVKVYENTDIRNFVTLEKFDFICVDVSFISLTKVIPCLTIFANENCEFVLLIKPQFELLRPIKNSKGIIKNKKYIDSAITRVVSCAQKNKLQLKGIDKSPIKGKDGNIELLAYFIKK
ncbi:MAG: TlyA family RNA methyltransferase [Candidatus Goldbacteria bacterium]|nr:TlyA family RNA methyltransferase [Candidatus Goldiibacteriota bacterium]